MILNADALDPEEKLLNDSLNLEIERALQHIGEREADIIRLFYGLHGVPPHSLDEIGEKFNLTRERVRQIKEKSILKLKNQTRSCLLRNYLG